MIRHIVLFKVHEGTPTEQIQDAVKRLEGLVEVIPGLRSLQAGTDIGLEGNLDFGLVAELDDRAALDSFSNDPQHMEVALDIRTFRHADDIHILDIEV